MTSVFKLIVIFTSMVYFMAGCRTNETAKDRISVQNDSGFIKIAAEHFNRATSELQIIADVDATDYFVASTGGWTEYAIQVKEAGRYRVEVYAKTTEQDTVNCWIEDYADNDYGRTYNITGNMMLPKASGSAGFTAVKKEGSPLDTGKHIIRLHFEKANVMVHRICFTLLKPHKKSPVVYTQQTDGKEWKLTWSDEFDGEGLPDTSKWVYDFGDWGWGNNELQYYTDARTENARLEDGNLVIEARKNDNGHHWTSARLTTRGKESFLYGKIEFRAKVPVGRGTWSAGWLLGDDYVDEKSWPFCGEIDVMEMVGYEMDPVTSNGKAHASIHCGAYYFKLNNQPTKIEEVTNMTGDFHTYSMEWMPDSIKIFIDGKPYFTYNDTKTKLSWPYDKPQNLIVNLAMGGGWGGRMGVDAALTSQKLVVDYVRVYELQ